MSQSTIFNPEAYTALLKRLEVLHAGSGRQWGTMTPAQMLAHVNLPLETGLGVINPPREGNFITRPLARWYVLFHTRFHRNLPTLKAFQITGQRDFYRERQRLLVNLTEAYGRGLGGPWYPHHAFGELTARQWGLITYRHLDHHLRQFGV